MGIRGGSGEEGSIAHITSTTNLSRAALLSLSKSSTISEILVLSSALISPNFASLVATESSCSVKLYN